MPCGAFEHRYVYRRGEQLTAGITYHYQVRNMRDVYILQSTPADSVMYLVDDNHRIVARNDDYAGRASEIIYRPERSGTYILLIRSFNYFSPGYCDLYRGAFGAQPVLVESDILFWGVTRLVTWSPGQIFETTNSTGDPYLIFLFADQVEGKAYFGPGIDDAGAGLNSRFIAPPFSEGGTGPAVGKVVLGSYSRSTQGECEFCQDDPSAVAPRGELASQGMTRFAARLVELKDAIDGLAPNERERRVEELRQSILLRDERRVLFGPPPEPTPELVRAHEEYLRQYKDLEQESEGLSYNERFRRLEALEARILAL